MGREEKGWRAAQGDTGSLEVRRAALPGTCCHCCVSGLSSAPESFMRFGGRQLPVKSQHQKGAKASLVLICLHPH